MNRLKYILMALSTFRITVWMISIVIVTYVSAHIVCYVSPHVSLPSLAHFLLFVFLFLFLFSLIDLNVVQIEKCLDKNNYVSNRLFKFIGSITTIIIIVGISIFIIINTL